MELLSIKIAHRWEICDAFVINIIANLPLLSFTKFMDNSNDCSMPVRSEVFLTDLPKYPTSCTIFTVDELVDFNFVIVKINILSIMFGDEISKIKFQLIGNDCVSIS